MGAAPTRARPNSALRPEPEEYGGRGELFELHSGNRTETALALEMMGGDASFLSTGLKSEFRS